ncbi:CorA family divalent cation transporter [Intrasporangium calvum]|uniref:Mg2 transporter protein CorA family protein n=1 Tax=Intrasporangium calvum (strain ATCC 23552 / DSM 43043 / JCM 3097 / NBRC 12989 / NCIMB 10167 / NRRL B-3866 / 7 KIP) TaxID=710696 RepID=E6S9A8_INTC7|nr:CorA family divalent cation transporter [Intrasporangium calvum]ADU47084.1 Mg2 transporter protein CorA family protein [Intrasporangium calvum DSM 43043]AXG12352.1 magnesium and cobalt transport protein CorA [Intrasporangium calvum]
MIIDCALYRDGRRQQEAALTLDTAAALHQDGSEGFAWLGTFEPAPDELERIRDSFGLHELAVEDVQTFHLRPKMEQYDHGVELVILRTARYDDEREEVDFGEISVFIAPTFVITVRQGVASELHTARTNLEARPDLLAEGSPAVLWAILDQVIKSYGPVVAELERDIEQVESTVFAGEAAPTERIYFLRREVTNFYRAVHPLLTVLTTIERTYREGPLAPYLHDVHDYLRLISDEVAAQRDLLATILEANMAVISVEQTRLGIRQGQTIERLTVLATVFLPLTFVTGFFGQNFPWLVEHLDGFGRFVVLGIGGLVLPLVVLWVLLRRDRGRLDRST